MGKSLSRRDFLRIAGLTSTSFALSACGLSSSELPTPAVTPSSTALATATDTPPPTITPTSHPPTLRELADQVGLELGVSFQGFLIAEQPRFYDVLRTSFNLTVINSGLYWSQQELRRGQFNYSDVTTQLRQLRRAFVDETLTIRGHPLYWPKRNPAWLLQDYLSKEEAIDLLRSHIGEVVGSYKNSIKQWVVVNEPYLRNHPTWRSKDVFYKSIGPDYFEVAFQAAREADPSAILIFNETDNYMSNGSTTDQARDIVAQLKSKNLIDGVGCQMHLDGAFPPDQADMISTMQSYGVPVYVTELDVDMTKVGGTDEERFAKQAKIFAGVLSACLQSGVCSSLTCWEMVDKYSWLEIAEGRPRADPTLFDDNMQPKPAYYALEDVLKDRLGA